MSLGLPQQLAMLMDRLLGQGIDLDATESIIQQARESLTPQELRDDIVVRHAALRAIESLLPPAAELPARGSRIALVGPHGCGKTTTIAKLAAAAKFRRGQSVTLVSLDRQKVGGAEQLRAYADVLDVPFRSASTKSQLAEVLREVNTDLVFIDTA
ncbi:MAG TPA: AAA family ATPase, partial [Marmoricola sp.]|nr:AAA family ATPase [Marmoricola sp.]